MRVVDIENGVSAFYDGTIGVIVRQDALELPSKYLREAIEIALEVARELSDDEYYYEARGMSELEKKRERYRVRRPILYAEIKKRDGEKCKMCGDTKRLEIDHITPLSKGGGDELDNLQILCKSCNTRKGAR
jgi:hypothetical protein